ncbi:hypothetical protein HPB52_024642 [Rhipicephalus sanguineus]|uniref:Uncharacterized protein n=1 Tax=Rhipicephalus sanguineus TaxID=34632 RepID=A0A9D4TE24_RHISA|nr:hypothetical protein HPB52_024642 [Rhipicephalus sanguineus]
MGLYIPPCVGFDKCKRTEIVFFAGVPASSTGLPLHVVKAPDQVNESSQARHNALLGMPQRHDNLKEGLAEVELPSRAWHGDQVDDTYGRRRGAWRRFVPEFYDTHQPIIIHTSIPARPPPRVEEGKICFGKTVPARTRGLPLGAKRQTDVASLTAPRQRDSAMGLQFGAATSVAAHKTYVPEIPHSWKPAGSYPDGGAAVRLDESNRRALNCDRIGATVWRGNLGRHTQTRSTQGVPRGRKPAVSYSDKGPPFVAANRVAEHRTETTDMDLVGGAQQGDWITRAHAKHG